jgi:hypothetical protein
MSTASLFSSIPPTKASPFFEGAAPVGPQIVKFLDFKRKDVARSAKVSEAAVRYEQDRMSEVLRAWLIEVGTAIALVDNFFKDTDKTELWFRTPNPLLGNITPIDMIRMGRQRKLLTVIQASLSENP